MKVRSVLDSAASVSMIAVAAFLFWQYFQAEPPVAPSRGPTIPADAIPLEARLSRGSDTASVTMIIVSEFQCPFCAKFATETLPQLEKRYVSNGKVRLAFRHFPLEMHLFAKPAAEVAECAGRQGKFWELHDRLFDKTSSLSDAIVVSTANEAGIDQDLLQACRSEGAGDVVKADVGWAKGLKVFSTPTFFFGIKERDGRLRIKEAFSGARPVDDFSAVLDRLLSEEPRR